MQAYAIVTNNGKQVAGITDHTGSGRNLKVGEQAKFILDEKNMEGAIRHYQSFSRVGGLLVQFSEGVAMPPVHENKTTVVSTADVDQALANRVAFLRKETAQKEKANRALDARKNRALAEATIRANKENVPVEEKPEEAPITKARKPLFEEDQGQEITPELLSKMEKPELYDMAAKIGLDVRKGVSKGGLEKAILLKIGK